MNLPKRALIFRKLAIEIGDRILKIYNEDYKELTYGKPSYEIAFFIAYMPIIDLWRD